MLRPEFGEELTDRSYLAIAGVFESLADSFARVR